MASDAARPRRLTRRRFLRLCGGTLAGVAVAGAYARGLEPGWLAVDRVEVPLPRREGEPRLRIVHLSDLHASDVVPLTMIADAVRLALAQAPDLVVLTGDFVTTRSEQPNREAYAAVLRPLAEHCPTFACLGNHDGPRRGSTAPWVNAMLAAADIPVLLNSTRRLDVKGRPLLLSGLGDLWTNECRPQRCLFGLGQADADRPAQIVLAHNPDSKTLAQFYEWDLMLCGHTHGGQVRLPFLGAPIVPVDDRGYIEGLHPFQNRHIYTTRGVGNLLGFRFNCRPWVSVVEG